MTQKCHIDQVRDPRLQNSNCFHNRTQALSTTPDPISWQRNEWSQPQFSFSWLPSSYGAGWEDLTAGFRFCQTADEKRGNIITRAKPNSRGARQICDSKFTFSSRAATVTPKKYEGCRSGAPSVHRYLLIRFITGSTRRQAVATDYRNSSGSSRRPRAPLDNFKFTPAIPRFALMATLYTHTHTHTFRKLKFLTRTSSYVPVSSGEHHSNWGRDDYRAVLASSCLP